MRFNKLVLIALLTLVMLVATACGNDDKEGAEDAKEAKEEQTAPTTGEEVTFPDLDRSELGADVVVATYDGGEIKGDELAQYLAFQGFIAPHYPLNDPAFRTEALRFLIAEKLIIAEETNDKNLETAQDKVDQTWEDIVKRYDDETREKGLKKLGITEDEIKQALARFLTVQDHFAENISEADIQEYYDSVKADITTADVRHILVQTHERQQDGSMKEVRTDAEAKKIADELYKQLEGGADFAELAKEKSEDPGSKDNGGLYEGQPASQWVPEFSKAVLEQEVGKIGQPVKTEFGYHIIRVEKRDSQSLDDVREPIVATITNEKFMEYFEQTLPGKIKEINIDTEKAQS